MLKFFQEEFVFSMTLTWERYFTHVVFAILYKPLSLKFLHCGLNVFFQQMETHESQQKYIVLSNFLDQVLCSETIGP